MLTNGLPPDWKWMLSVERRLWWLRREVHGLKTTERKGRSQTWAPRDWMMAGAGLAMVLAALFEKIGWSHVLVGLVRLYGGK